MTDTRPSDRETACFEAGVKFGSLYHQFAGTPLSPASADSLASAIEDSIENQPHCDDVVVDVREDRLREDLADGPASYTEFTGEFADVDIYIDYEGILVHAQMRMTEGYPLMDIAEVRE